jgi:hypothetical protein
VDKREAAAVLAQCKWLKDNIKRWEDAAKTVLSHELSPGERAAAVDAEGTQLGFAAMVAGRREVKINDEHAFTAWVAQRWPTEMSQQIKPEFRAKLFDQAKTLGGVPDPVDGTVCPFVAVVGYDPFPKVTLSEWADSVLTQRIKQKKLMDVITPPSELPAPEGTRETAEMYRSDPPAAQHISPETQLSDSPTVEPEPELDPEPGTWDEPTTFESSHAVRQRRGYE